MLGKFHVGFEASIARGENMLFLKRPMCLDVASNDPSSSPSLSPPKEDGVGAEMKGETDILAENDPESPSAKGVWVREDTRDHFSGIDDSFNAAVFGHHTP